MSKRFKQFISEIYSKTSAVIINSPTMVGATVDDYGNNVVKDVPIKSLVMNEPAWEKIKDLPKRVVMHRKLVRQLKSNTETDIPAIKVARIPGSNGKMLVVDGHHRYAAYFDAGRRTIRAEVINPANIDYVHDEDEYQKTLDNHTRNVAERNAANRKKGIPSGE